jgi:fatty-acid desaturase
MWHYKPSEKPNNIIVFCFLFTLHGAALFGLIFFRSYWHLLPLTFTYIFLIQNLGITFGYHRCLAHRSFEFRYKWMERLFVTFGCCGFQMGPIWWCSIHRMHHKYSDTSQDPHDRTKGFWYSHITWLIHLDPHYTLPPKSEFYFDNVKDIYADPYYRWLDKYFFVPWICSLAAFYSIGAWPWVFWGGIIPFLYHHHATWLVNSVTHRLGYRSFETKPLTDRSTNNWLIGLLAIGEGWHNNHHAFPSSAKHGFFRWWELDLTYIVIVLFRNLGLVNSLKIPLQGTNALGQSSTYASRQSVKIIVKRAK